MYKQMSLNVCVVIVAFFSHGYYVLSSDAPADSLTPNRYNAPEPSHPAHLEKISQHAHVGNSHHYQQVHHHAVPAASGHAPSIYHPPVVAGHIEKRNSYNLLSEAMSQAVSNEFSALGSGSADGACHADDLECYTNNVQDRLGMEAIRTLHRQLDDDDNGNIDLSESDDFLREELKYDSGYEKRQKAFHFNDDMHISVKELWEAWLRSEVHNWTIEQTTDWLAQSVQLPQYVELFKLHKVTGAALPRLAVNNMHYVGNVLGIKDPIHKQKIALKAMDVVLFGPPRETGTRWKDYILVTLLLSAIIGCWYAYQQNKNAKRHLRRMAQDMEGLQRAEQSLQEMQKELERARMEQESVETEKLDLERRLKEAPLLSSSSSDLEVQQLKKEIEMLRSELSRAEIELVDNCWTPPPQLQSWLQYTYELESKNHLKKRVGAEKQLQSAREACEKLRKKRSSLVGAFVSTHGKSIDDVDRSIVEARNSLSEVTNELQERLHRWKQIETCLGFNIVNNNGLPYLESVLYGRNGGLGSVTASSKGSRGRMTNSTDDLDDESVAAQCYDPKAQTWCHWRSTPHISQDNSSSNSSNYSAAEAELSMPQPLPPQVATFARRWLSNTARLASNRPPRHHHLYTQPHQMSQPTMDALDNYRCDGQHPNESVQQQRDSNITLNYNSIKRSNSPVQSQSPLHASNHCRPQSVCNPYAATNLNMTTISSESIQQHQQHQPPQQQTSSKPNQRPLLRRHTVIPSWKKAGKQQAQVQSQPTPSLSQTRSVSTVAPRNGDEDCAFLLAEAARNPPQIAETASTTMPAQMRQKPSLHNSCSDGCLTECNEHRSN